MCLVLQAYFAPNTERKNLTVLTGAVVRKVITEAKENGLLVATGVEFSEGKDGGVHSVGVRKEVTMCAGCVVPLRSSTECKLMTSAL